MIIQQGISESKVSTMLDGEKTIDDEMKDVTADTRVSEPNHYL